MASIRGLNNYFRFMPIFLLFMLLNFDQQLSLIYLFIMVTDFIFYNIDNFISFRILVNRKRLGMILVESAAALGIFLASSNFLLRFLSPQSLSSSGIVQGAQSIFELLSTSTPILQGSQFLTLIGWGVLVPIIETSFFNGRMLEFFTEYSEKLLGKKVSLKKFSFELLIIIGVVAAIFTLYHITAKGLASAPLLITFIFSVISSVLVIRQQELSGAIAIHIATNSLAVAAGLGWF